MPPWVDLVKLFVAKLQVDPSFNHPTVVRGRNRPAFPSSPRPQIPPSAPRTIPRVPSSSSRRVTALEYYQQALLTLDLPLQMAEPNGTTPAENANFAAPTSEVSSGKGKGKAVDTTTGKDVSMDQDLSESSEEESGNEAQAPEVEEEDEDNMEEIDTSNIIQGGRRTRGKQIDYEEAERKAREAGDNLDEDDDDDEDDDFEMDDDEDDQMKD